MASDLVNANQKDPFYPFLLRDFPDYERFTANDFDRLTEDHIRGIVGRLATKKSPGLYIPDSFKEKYGAGAAGEVMLALARVLAKRGNTEIYATALLNSGFSEAGGVYTYIDSNVPVSFVATDGKLIDAMAPQIMNFMIAQAALEVVKKNEAAKIAQGAPSNSRVVIPPVTEMEAFVPREVTAAIVAANRKLPNTLLGPAYSFKITDEGAYMAGYATANGASADVGPVTMNYPPQMMCHLKPMTDAIFNPDYNDADVGKAFFFGYMQGDLDQMPSAQRHATLASCHPQKTAAGR